MRELEPGGQLAGYRIDAVEREENGASVLLAHDPEQDRQVLLRVAGEAHFAERARRVGAVEHPNLVPIEGTKTIEGRCVAIGPVPPGQRLDRLKPNKAATMRIVVQLASAVDALEDYGVDPPPLDPERIWVDGEHAYLDGLHTRDARATSPAAELAELLGAGAPKRVRTRALEGAYLSAGQFASELSEAQAEQAHQRRQNVVAGAVVAAVVLVLVILETLL